VPYLSKILDMSIGAKKENTVLITERMKKHITASTENNCLA